MGALGGPELKRPKQKKKFLRGQRAGEDACPTIFAKLIQEVYLPGKGDWAR